MIEVRDFWLATNTTPQATNKKMELSSDRASRAECSVRWQNKNPTGYLPKHIHVVDGGLGDCAHCDAGKIGEESMTATYDGTTCGEIGFDESQPSCRFSNGCRRSSEEKWEVKRKPLTNDQLVNRLLLSCQQRHHIDSQRGRGRSRQPGRSSTNFLNAFFRR